MDVNSSPIRETNEGSEISSSPSEYYSVLESEIFLEIDSVGSLISTNGPIDETNRNKERRRRNLIPTIRHLFSNSPTSIADTRVYQVWPGNNVFFFRGHLVCGPDPRGFVLTFVSIILSNWIFCIYIGKTLRNHRAVLITSSMILTVIVIVNLILVSTRDPGIVPRSLKPSDEVGTGFRTRSLRINVDGVEMKLKYCRVCRNFRSPRTCHCAVCDNCVEKFDHHCPWIGQCIGLRNYRYYMMFIISAFMFFAYIFTFSWWRIRRKGLTRVIGNAPEIFALALFSFTSMLFLGGLVVLHLYLSAVNQTASENFKRRYEKSRNPYDKGILRNIKESFFTRLEPSTVNFRAIVEPKYSSIARMLFKTNKVSEGDMFADQYPAMHEEESHRRSSENGHIDGVEINIK